MGEVGLKVFRSFMSCLCMIPGFGVKLGPQWSGQAASGGTWIFRNTGRILRTRLLQGERVRTVLVSLSHL